MLYLKCTSFFRFTANEVLDILDEEGFFTADVFLTASNDGTVSDEDSDEEEGSSSVHLPGNMLDSEADFKITYNNGEVMDSLTEVIEEPIDKEDHEDVLMVTVNEISHGDDDGLSTENDDASVDDDILSTSSESLVESDEDEEADRYLSVAFPPNKDLKWSKRKFQKKKVY